MDFNSEYFRRLILSYFYEFVNRVKLHYPEIFFCVRDGNWDAGSGQEDYSAILVNVQKFIVVRLL